MLIDRNCPKASREIIGNRLAVAEIEKFLKGWASGQALLVTGETGVGKTLAVRLVARELGFDVVEVGADSERGYKDMEFLLKASQQTGLFGRKLFLIDELDQMESSKAVLQLIAVSRHPVVLIAEDQYDRKLYSLRQKCRQVHFQKVRYDSLAAFLRTINSKEGLGLDEKDLEQIAKQSGGDVRAALMDLELLAAGGKNFRDIGYREKAQSIFEALMIIFKTQSFENAMIALNSTDDPDELVRWIGENAAHEYEGTEDIARAYEMLSRADIFASRIIKRQSWGLQKYQFELSAAGVAVSKKAPYKKFVKYARPRFRQRQKGEAAQKIARQLHVSSRRIGEYLALIRRMKSKKMLDELGISKEELREI